MGCKCSSNRKAKVKEQMQIRLLETEFFKMAIKMKDRDPSSLTNPQLLDYHKKTHMLYSGNVNRKPPNKQFVNSIVDLHNKFVKEMKKRGLQHKTPLDKI